MLNKSALALVTLGFSINALASPPNGCVENSLTNHSFRVEGSDFIAINKPIRFNAYQNMAAYEKATLTFNTSEDGIVGSNFSENVWDITSTQRFSYNIIFNSPSSRGNGYVWVDNSKQECVYKQATIHNFPTLVITSATNSYNGEPLSASASGAIDTLSKLGQQGSTGTYTWTFTNIGVGGVPIKTISTGTNNSVSYTPTVRGEYKVTVRISDGVFKASEIAYVYFNGGSGGGSQPL